MRTEFRMAAVARRLQTGGEPGAGDYDLLGRYARDRDEAAFAALVRRHGGLVLGVARRQLAPADLADDVFQATFLALARAAGRLRERTPLANWLYTVALRQARKARTRAARRAEVERAVPPPAAAATDPLAAITGRDLVRAVDEELARLPDRYRLPVLLCCVQGLSREEAAAQLGWTDGAVKGRLERGRRRLAGRLAARGLAPAGLLFAPAVSLVVPPDLLARTTALAAAPWSRTVPAGVAALAAATAPRRLIPALVLAGSLVATGLAGWALAGGQSKPKDAGPAPPPARIEPASPVAADPLPAGSTLRFGTDRFRHGTRIGSLAVAPDGTFAVAASGGHIHGAVRAFDLADGRVRYTLNRQIHSAMTAAVSPDGTTLATVGDAGNRIHLQDAKTGKVVRHIDLPGTNGGTITGWITFTPDGKGVALTQGDARGVVLVDIEKGAAVRTFPHANVVYAAAFSPDGKRMAAGGYDSEKGGYFARLWDVETGKELRRLLLGRGGLRTLAFSPDGKSVAGGGDGGSARVWEADTGKELLAPPADGYRVRSVAFAPDGKTLAAAGDAIRLYDLASGKERLKIDRQAVGLHFSPDGKVLTGAVTGTIFRWDTTTGRALTPEGAGESAVDQVLATADGRRLITRGQDGDAHVWDARTGAHVRHIQATWQRGVALSPDGRFLVWPVEDKAVQFKDPAQPNVIHTGSRIKLYDLSADAFVDRFPGFEGDAQALAFTADGKQLVTVDHRDGGVRVWEVATGKELRSFRAVREGEAALSHHVWGAVLSPDGRTLAVTYQPLGRGIFSPFPVRLWDVATGKERHDLAGHHYYVAMAFSPDSRLVVTASQPLQEFAQQQLKRPVNQVFVWDVATGQRVAAVPDGLPTGADVAAFAPDGRTLALASAGTVEVWEVSTWTKRTEYRGHRDRVNSLAFGPDGRLFTGGLDTTVLAWDTRPPTVAEGAPAAAWDDLAGPKAGPAFRAQGRLLAAPAAAVELLAQKVKPVPTAAPDRLRRLVADLDSPKFAVREKASRELGEVGWAAAGALREARMSGSEEVVRRAGDLLADLEKSPPPVAALRGVEVLRWIGTPEARAVLRELAKGAPEAPITRSAATALASLSLRD